MNKNKWNLKTKPDYSEERGWSQKTTKFNKNNPHWSFTEDESDYEDVAELEPPDWRKVLPKTVTRPAIGRRNERMNA